MKKISIILCLLLCLQMIFIPLVTTYAASNLTSVEGKQIQQKLKDLGYYKGKINGTFKSSYEALNTFFEDKGVTTKNGKLRTVSSNNTWSDISNSLYTQILNTSESGLTKLDRKNETDKSFLKAILDCKAYTAAHGFKYCYCGSKACVNLNKSERQSCLSVHQVDKKYVTNCSEGVTAAIFEYAKINNNEKLKTRCKNELTSSHMYAKIAGEILKGKKDTNFKLIKNIENIKVGDIMYSDTHVEIYAGKENGKMMVYNWGNNKAIATPGATESNISKSEIIYVLRLKPIE